MRGEFNPFRNKMPEKLFICVCSTYFVELPKLHRILLHLAQVRSNDGHNKSLALKTVSQDILMFIVMLCVKGTI